MTYNHSTVLIDEVGLRALKSLADGLPLKGVRPLAYIGSGTSRSPFRTRGLDFQEIRAYQPGDDIRQIDWKTTAKHGKPYTKLFMDEKERPVYFVCDMRGCMRFASRGDFKSVVAARMTMFLAWLADRRQDKVGSVVLLPDSVRVFDLQGRGGLDALMAGLTAGGQPVPPVSDTISLEQALSLLVQQAKTGASVFVASDFHDATPTVFEILRRLARRRALTLFHIYDDMERDFPAGVWCVTDGTRTTAVDMRAAGRRESFTRMFNDRMQRLKNTAKTEGWAYHAFQTTDDYLTTVMTWAREGQT